MITSSAFKPWVKNCHVQTLLASYYGRNAGVRTVRERVELPDGDFIDLDWYNRELPEGAPTLCILHGLEGSIKSSYIQGLLKQYQTSGWRLAVIHFRGCSGEINRRARSYHSGDTEDLDFLINRLHGSGPLFLAGFSLGGNVLLKFLGERGSARYINAAVAVAVPFDLEQSAKRLDSGWSQFYRWYLLRDLKIKTLIKKRLYENDFDWPSEDEIRGYRSFMEFDHGITAPLHGFDSGVDYYQRCSCGQFLSQIEVPTLIIQSRDDPFMMASSIPKDADLAESVTLELSDHGGHMGFLEQGKGLLPGRYLDARIPTWLAEQQNDD